MRIRIMAVGFVAMLALAASAGAASATTKLWVENTALAHLPVGEVVHASITVEGCSKPYTGKLLVNGSSSDKLRYPTTTSAICNAGALLRGGALTWIATSELVSTVTSTPKFMIEFPNYCAYEIGTLVGSFAPSAILEIRGNVTGKLNKAVSLGESCPTTRSLGFIVEGKDKTGEAPLFTEIQ